MTHEQAVSEMKALTSIFDREYKGLSEINDDLRRELKEWKELYSELSLKYDVLSTQLDEIAWKARNQ